MKLGSSFLAELSERQMENWLHIVITGFLDELMLFTLEVTLPGALLGFQFLNERRHLLRNAVCQ